MDYDEYKKELADAKKSGENKIAVSTINSLSKITRLNRDGVYTTKLNKEELLNEVVEILQILSHTGHTNYRFYKGKIK